MQYRTRTWLAMAAVLAVAAGPCAPAFGQASAVLAVSARVQRHASVRMTQPPSLTLSEADIARGYVEIPTPIEVIVQSNVQQGYTLVFERQGEQVRQVHVQGLDGAVTVGEAGAASARRAAGQGMWREALQLRLRFDLSPLARPGLHAWPLHISMMSL